MYINNNSNNSNTVNTANISLLMQKATFMLLLALFINKSI